MAFLSNITSLFAQQTVQAIAAGLLTGVIGGTALVASGIVPTGGTQATAQTVDLLACPGTGPVLARVANGEALLLTARSADGSWFEVYVGQPGVDRGWAPATSLQVDSEAGALPVADCSVPTAGPLPAPTTTAPAVVVTPSPEPSAPPTASPTAAPSVTARPTPTLAPTPTTRPTRTPTPTKTPTPTPTKTPTPTPTKTPAPTPTPVNHAPSLSNLSANPNCIDNNGGIYPQSVISVTATDPDAGDTLAVRIRLNFNDTLYRFPLAMTHVGGSLWQYTVTRAALQSYGWGEGQIGYDVTARDSHGVDSATLSDDPFSSFNRLSYNPISGCSPF